MNRTRPFRRHIQHSRSFADNSYIKGKLGIQSNQSIKAFQNEEHLTHIGWQTRASYLPCQSSPAKSKQIYPAIISQMVSQISKKQQPILRNPDAIISLPFSKGCCISTDGSCQESMNAARTRCGMSIDTKMK